MQTLKIIFSVLSVIAFAVAYIPYIRDIFLRRTQPHAYTWFIWAITQGTAVVGIWYGRGGLGSLGLGITEILLIFTFFLSLKYGTRNITASDTILLLASLLAIFIWWYLNNPLLAIMMVSLIDILGGYIPTYRKTWEEPWSETLLSWELFLLGDILSILALTEYNLLTLTYLVTIGVCNIIFIALCIFRRSKVPSPFVSKQ